MLYKFKSDAGGDVIMLEPTGRQLLQIMGKSTEGQGILLPEQMSAAKAAIEAAIALEELGTTQNGEGASEGENPANKRIRLRTRAWPLVTLIENSAKTKVPITWGV